jgi:23S rRNA pseudouridine2605 synthase
MDRHPKDNAKNPRPRQDAGRDGPRNFADKGERKPFAKGGAKPGGFKPGGAKAGGKDARPAAEPKRTERIAKAMARAGIASRREVERLIGLGKVAVNGKILDTPATLVTRDDKITVDGKPIGSAQATRVWRYHKPAGLLTSHNDPAGRPTVFDALPSGLPRVISVGRLDLNTEGLLLLTNDGELSRALELPTSALVRQYRARARGRVTQEELDKLKTGCTVDGVHYGPIEATLDKAKDTPEGERGPANLWISVSITEGKNREVRKVLESVGLTVNRLIRLAYGPFQLGTLPIGAVEEVGPRVIREMLADHIRPENLPTGNTVETPAPIPGRRVSTPKIVGASGSALSDPSRKPSRVRAAETAQADAVERRERPAKKAGWAKAAPKFEHTKTFKPRARPEAAGGADVERPRKPFKRAEPRPDQFIEDRRAHAKGAPRAGGKSFGSAKNFGRSDARPEGARSGPPRAGGKPGGFGARPTGGKSFGGKPGGSRSGPPKGPRGPRSGG